MIMLATKPAWAEAIQHRREEMGITQEELALRADLSPSAVAKLEQGRQQIQNMQLANYVALCRELGFDPIAFATSFGLRMPVAEMPLRFEYRDRGQKFQVYGSVSAGDRAAEPLEDEWVEIPDRILKRYGVKRENVRVYLVNGDCMLSDGARSIKPGDYIAVDRGRRPQPGEVVVSWWPEEEKMVIKLYQVEREGILLTPTQPRHPVLVLPHEDDVNIFGPVFWRGGGL